MISVNQKAFVIVFGLALAFSFPADAIQSQSINGQGNQDPVMVNKAAQAQEDPADSSDAGDGEDSDDDASQPNYQVKAPDGVAKKEEKKKEEEQDKTKEHFSKDKHKSVAMKKENMRLELASNLRKQSDLKNTIEHLSNESASDQEIEDAAKKVANETESVEMADMLANMWKEQRMFELPTYTKHVDHELKHLKHDEQKLEAKMNGEPVKIESEDEEDEEEGEKKAVKSATPEDEGQASAVNFWRMSRRSQKSVFMSSLVYLIGGLLAAVLFKQVRAKYFEPEQRLDAHPNTKDFSFSVFGCLGDLKLCALGFCCPCLAWANTLERRLKVPYWKAVLIFFGLLLLHVYTMGISSIFVVMLGAFYRQKLRGSYDIDSYESGSKITLAMDFLLWGFCQPCSIIQEAREETCKRDKQVGP